MSVMGGKRFSKKKIGTLIPSASCRMGERKCSSLRTCCMKSPLHRLSEWSGPGPDRAPPERTFATVDHIIPTDNQAGNRYSLGRPRRLNAMIGNCAGTALKTASAFSTSYRAPGHRAYGRAGTRHPQPGTAYRMRRLPYVPRSLRLHCHEHITAPRRCAMCWLRRPWPSARSRCAASM